MVIQVLSEITKTLQCDCNVKNRNYSIHGLLHRLGLKEDSSITIAPADKGNVTIIANSEYYKEKINQHLCETSTYLLINPNINDDSNNPNSALMRQNKRTTQRFEEREEDY